MADGKIEELPLVPLLRGTDDGDGGYLATVEVADADLALLAAFPIALDRVAGSRPGLEETLTERLGGKRAGAPLPANAQCGTRPSHTGRGRPCRRPCTRPSRGLRGASDHEMLSKVLRHAEGRTAVGLNEDEAAAHRVM
ncbi:hypothetical protein ABZ923_00365 [Streptomyces sp. NPDC046881]|uniref:hypothetical protein n=1 Tax=Streptomyces sp. NPDC046881 TaxID=3155374 RepID=UPI003405DFE8